jgi:DNA-binding transcriptional ArsR family regulator
MKVRPKRRKVRNRSEKGPTGTSGQEALVKALNHPLRTKALTILSERIASPKEIADELDVRLSNIAYHVRVLEHLGLIEIIEEEAVRGALAHFYKAVDRPLIENADWTSLDPEVRCAASGYLVETFISDVASSLSRRLFDRRDDRHASRTPLLLDEKGWSNVLAIQARAAEGILEEKAAAAQRISDSPGEVVNAVVGMFCFETPNPDA